MALKGDLASVDLAQVFQMLALNQKVGLLYIQSTTAWKALYFNEQGVTLYFNEHTMLDRVLAKLVRGGQISANGVLEAREHAAHQGHPVLGDKIYGVAPELVHRLVQEGEFPELLQAAGAPRQLLHCARLVVAHPGTGGPWEVRAPLPADFSEHLPGVQTPT